MKTDDAKVFPRIRLGVSACLLGEPVRYDGGHKRHAFLTDTLAAYADYLPLCPEAAIGLGIPRPPIHLVGDATRPRALGRQDPSLDVTQPLKRYAVDTLKTLESVSGYIFKKNSPSCGVRRVKVFTEPNRHARRKGTGIFARAIHDLLPLLPIEEEDGLDEPRRLDNFISRVYVLRRWQDLCAEGMNTAGLLDFHATHKYQVMAHSQAAYKRLGQMLSKLSVQPLEETAGVYIHELMKTLKRPGQRSQHYKVMQHIAGYLKHHPGSRQKTRLAAQLDAYRRGHLSRLEAISALKIQFERFPHPAIRQQTYLQPYPQRLLRHISEIPP